jgi:hypothetical protein
MEPQYPDNRQLFYAFCKAYLNARPEGGFITDQAARRLFEYVKEWGFTGSQATPKGYSLVATPKGYDSNATISGRLSIRFSDNSP